MVNDLVEAEWKAREDNGLPPHHALDTSDLGFKFTKVQGEFIEPIAHFLKGDLEKSEYSSRFMYNHILSCCVYSKEFMEYCKLPWDSGTLPPLHVIKRPPAGRVSFLSCDGNYFDKFGRYLLKSIKSPVHVHIMDPSKELAQEASELVGNNGLSIELPRGNPGYYHAVRLIRFADFVREQPAILLDVDALAKNDPLKLPEVPCGMRLRPGRIEPWNQFNASVIVGDWRAEMYFNMVAKYIWHFWKADKLIWQIDQAALFCVWTYLRNHVECLGPKEVDYDYHDDGIIWCNSGKNKWLDEDLSRQKYRDFLEEIKNING